MSAADFAAICSSSRAELSDEVILAISDGAAVTFKTSDGRRESPFIEGVDVTVDVLAFARTLLAMSPPAPAAAGPHCYDRFCQLRDHRDAGAEAPKYTEAEAFSLAIHQPLAAAPAFVLDVGLPELREQLKNAADAEAPITLSHISAAALVYAMSTGAPQPVAAPAPTPQECWSADEEDFNSKSLGELLDNNENLAAGSTVWVGEAVIPSMDRLCDAEDVIATMADRAMDIAGEHADDYPDVSTEAQAELDALLCAWMAKHCAPTFYTVTNIAARILTADDVPEPAAPTTTN